jgi:hypothetical protein
MPKAHVVVLVEPVAMVEVEVEVVEVIQVVFQEIQEMAE